MSAPGAPPPRSVMDWADVLATRGTGVFVHRRQSGDQGEAVSGPHDPHEVGVTVLESDVYGGAPTLRTMVDELPNSSMGSTLRFLDYETPDEAVAGSRARVDAATSTRPWDESLSDAAREAEEAFGDIVRALFQFGLCSMTRVVLSMRCRSEPSTVFVTARDREKVPGTAVRLAAARVRPEGGTTVFLRDGDQATSSAGVAARVHSLGLDGIVLHAHLVAPVAVGRGTDRLHVVNSRPRTDEFASELWEVLRTPGRCVLRRGEGVWAAGASPQEVMQAALDCQSEAIEALKAIARAG